MPPSDSIPLSQILPMAAALVVLIALSAYFSATEMAFSALNHVRIKNLAANGDKKAKLVLGLLERYDKMLTTVLIGNNIVNIAATTIATVLFVRIIGDAGATVSTVAMTLIVLCFGEIVPKTAAKRSPERFAMRVAGSIRAVMVVLTPLSWLFSQLQKAVNRRGQTDETRITEDELITIVQESQNSGGIDAGESELIRSAIEFGDLTAGDVLTPRVAVETVDLEDSYEEVEQVFVDSGYSRLPVTRGSVDSVAGILINKDFFAAYVGEHIPLGQLLKPVSFVPQSMPVQRLLKLLQTSKTHLAVVTDEFGGTLGIVTMEDIIEELVGEIYDEQDDEEAGVVPVGDGEYRVAGNVDMDDLLEQLGVEGETEATTVNGWAQDELHRIPVVGDRFDWHNLTVTVADADERKVNEVTVRVGEFETTAKEREEHREKEDAE